MNCSRLKNVVFKFFWLDLVEIGNKFDCAKNGLLALLLLLAVWLGRAAASGEAAVAVLLATRSCCEESKSWQTYGRPDGLVSGTMAALVETIHPKSRNA